VVDFDKNTYRTVYAVKIGDVIYVLHCFQKKSKHGIATPKQDIHLIQQRFNEAKQLDKERGKLYE
jgi:phage-related protein